MKNLMKVLTAIIIGLFTIILIFSCAYADTHKIDSAKKVGSLHFDTNKSSKKVNNIIFCIGDGMGLSKTALTILEL